MNIEPSVGVIARTRLSSIRERGLQEVPLSSPLQLLLIMIPSWLRRVENLHILFWLVKDVCWVTDFKAPGILMIAPTMGIALWMTWRLRRHPSEFAHNLAVAFWIAANSIWMIGEFYYDDQIRPFARVFFIGGLIVLLVYYIGHSMGRFRVPTHLSVVDESDQQTH